MASPPEIALVSSHDDPIETAEQDSLGRGDFVAALAATVRAATREGAVIALTGPWGCGKSSLLNLIERELEGAVVVLRFNPWFFSGTEDLVVRFFDELGAQLGERGTALAAVGDKLRRYGRLAAPLRFLPVLGRAIELGSTVAKEIGDEMAEPPSLESRRRELSQTLVESRARIVVMVDDIDRLEDGEIAQVMKLVRLVGDLPRIAYVLAYDEQRVGRAVATAGGDDGVRFLQKIVQFAFPVPEVGGDQLKEVLTTQLRPLLKQRAVVRTDDAEIAAVIDAIAPFFETVRDVRRFACMLPFALHLSGRDVAVADIVALEALRLLAPEDDRRINEVMDVADRAADGLEVLDGAVLDALRQGGAQRQRRLRRFIEAVLPPLAPAFDGDELDLDALEDAGERGRVAHPATWRVYREKVTPSTWISRDEIGQLADALGDRAWTTSKLSALDDSRFRQVLVRLPEALRSSSSPGVVASGVVALLERAAAVPRTDTGYLRNAAPLRTALDALFGQLDESGRCETLAQALPALDDLLLRYFLVSTALRSNAPNLPATTCVTSVQGRLRTELLALDRDALAQQGALAYMLQWVARKHPTSRAEVVSRLRDDRVLIQFAATLSTRTRIDVELRDGWAGDARLSRLVADLIDRTDDRSQRAVDGLERLVKAEPTSDA